MRENSGGMFLIRGAPPAILTSTEETWSAGHFICEITGHSRESSLDDYYEINEIQRKELSHTISGFSKASSKSSKVSQNSANGASSNQAIAIKQRAPLSNLSSLSSLQSNFPYPTSEPDVSDNGFQSCSLLDFQDSNLVLLPSTWQLSPAVQFQFQHKITWVVRSINFSCSKEAE